MRKNVPLSPFVVKLPYWLLSILTKIKGPPCSLHSRSPVFKTKPNAQGPAPFPWPRPLRLRPQCCACAVRPRPRPRTGWLLENPRRWSLGERREESRLQGMLSAQRKAEEWKEQGVK